jgi:hypothetical protein
LMATSVSPGKILAISAGLFLATEMILTDMATPLTK